MVRIELPLRGFDHLLYGNEKESTMCFKDRLSGAGLQRDRTRVKLIRWKMG